jgi:RNA polymerase sigma-70 factor (ECF subfamily)
MTKGKSNITAEGAIERYADMVYRLALSQMGNKQDADDIFQEVFVRLVKHVHNLQTWKHVKAWLIKVTINCCKKHFAQYWNKNVYPMETLKIGQTVEEGYSIPEEGIPVTAVVGKLPPKYRYVIYLFYYEELSIIEIGKVTGQKESTIKSQLFRAREMLKEMLKGDVDI